MGKRIVLCHGTRCFTAAVASSGIILILGDPGAKGIGPAITPFCAFSCCHCLDNVCHTATVFSSSYYGFSRAEAADIALVLKDGTSLCYPTLLLLLIPAHRLNLVLKLCLNGCIRVWNNQWCGIVCSCWLYHSLSTWCLVMKVWPFFFLGLLWLPSKIDLD